ncbi:LysE/ArgO family amino acid transporter [Neisseriaceae bacterium B1]
MRFFVGLVYVVNLVEGRAGFRQPDYGDSGAKCVCVETGIVAAICVLGGICFVCDFLLIGLGVLGVGGLISQSPVLSLALALGGALFLLWYGVKSFRAALSKQHGALLVQENGGSGSLKATVLSTLVITLLNPHVYIDTVVLIGGIAALLRANEKPWFLLGTVCVSFVWFFGLDYGARLLNPIFANPKAWRVLEFLIGAMMWYLSFGLFKFVWLNFHSV